MTKEEVIKTLHELWRETNDSWYEKTYKMAIEALSADRPTENDGCKDCRYEANDEYEYPCKDCKQNYTDKWKPKRMEDRREGEWVPVEERLPDENKEVLMSLEWGIDIGEHRDGEWHSEWINHYDDGSVLAWMPLPEPYKGGDDDD